MSIANSETAALPATPPPSLLWLDLPAPLVGGIFQLAAQGNMEAFAAINLTSRAFHTALPAAFMLGDRAKSSPSHAFNREVLIEWPPDLDAPAQATWRVLRFNLSSAAFAGLRPAALVEAVRRIGRRFAEACSLRLSLSEFSGHGASLFAEHIAPQMLYVRRLSLTGVPDVTLPALFLEPVLRPLARSLRELCVSGPYCTVEALRTQLPAAFPALTKLQLHVALQPARARWRR